jgi:hypothetical protein
MVLHCSRMEKRFQHRFTLKEAQLNQSRLRHLLKWTITNLKTYFSLQVTNKSSVSKSPRNPPNLRNLSSPGQRLLLRKAQHARQNLLHHRPNSRKLNRKNFGRASTKTSRGKDQNLSNNLMT